MSVTVIAEIRVCLCCALSHANGECCESTTHGGDSCEPLALLNGKSIALTQDDDETFSTNPCEGCGSLLAGERYEMAIFSE